MNQNFTVLLVCFMTLKTMMEANRFGESAPLPAMPTLITHLIQQSRSNSKDIDIRLPSFHQFRNIRRKSYHRLEATHFQRRLPTQANHNRKKTHLDNAWLSTDDVAGLTLDSWSTSALSIPGLR